MTVLKIGALLVLSMIALALAYFARSIFKFTVWIATYVKNVNVEEDH